MDCSQQYENQLEFMQNTKRPRLDIPSTSIHAIVAASAIPSKTHEDTKYCINIWNDWCKHRSARFGETISPIEELPTGQLANHLCRFIYEIRKQDSSEFPPNSLHHIVSGIQRFIRWNGKPAIDIFKDGEFAEFRVCLDSEMKRLQRSGLGSQKKKAEPLTIEEEVLWQKGLLGANNPQALVDSMVVLNGLYFALRSGSEHRQLRSHTPAKFN